MTGETRGLNFAALHEYDDKTLGVEVQYLAQVLGHDRFYTHTHIVSVGGKGARWDSKHHVKEESTHLTKHPIKKPLRDRRGLLSFNESLTGCWEEGCSALMALLHLSILGSFQKGLLNRQEAI